MISRRRLEATRKKMPERVKVRVYSLRAADEIGSAKQVVAERRPVSISEQRGSDAAGDATVSVYVFYQCELRDRVLKEGDTIEDLEKRSFHAIDTLSEELAGTRIVARCYPAANPKLDLS